MRPPLQFRLNIIPPKTTHQAKKIVRIGGFSKLADKPELVAVINDYLTLLQPHAPEKPFDGAVKLTLEFIFPWRKSESKKNRLKSKIPMTSKPDWDNLGKTIADTMTKLKFWNDDAQITQGRVCKYWGDNVGITITIQEIEEI